ncbi:hypothetical protein QBC45DRAFT_397719 [Copromyces sp. CBS 386.78]|nr:hypothetical protein QBC45DRAFT_397719 [Copromyces sp. CBS 386.78]
MSQNAANAREKGAERWATFLLDKRINDKESVTEVLQHLAEAHHKRVAPVWDSNEHSIAWRNYFVAALQKVLRELPSQRTSTEELHEEIERLKAAPVEAAATQAGNDDAVALPKGDDDANDDAGKNSTEEASQPLDTSTTETITSTSTSTRRLLSTTTTTTETGIKIDTQGECRARVMEDSTIELRLSGPATVTYRPAVTTTSGTGTAHTVIAAAVAAAAAARGIPFVPEGQVHETTTTTEETVEELVGSSSGSDASDGTSTVRDTPSGSDASDDTSTVRDMDTPSEDTLSDSESSDQTQVHTPAVTGTAAAQARSPTTGTATIGDTSVVYGTPSDMESQTQTHTSGTATPGTAAAHHTSAGTTTPGVAVARGTPSQSRAQVHTSETPKTCSVARYAAARGTPSGTTTARGTGTPSVPQAQVQTSGTAAARGSGTPSETAAALRDTGTWAEVDIADIIEQQRWQASSILRQAMLHDPGSARPEELPSEGNMDATTSVPQTLLDIGTSRTSISAAAAGGAGTGTTSVSETLVLPLRARPAGAAAGGTGTSTPSVAPEQDQGNISRAITTAGGIPSGPAAAQVISVSPA